MTKIHPFFIEIRRPAFPGDVGKVEEGRYIVEGNTVVLTGFDGVPLLRSRVGRKQERWEKKLAPGENPIRIAKRLLRERYDAINKGSDFGRKLNYPPLGIV